jgi:hypothetical protein
MTSTTSTESVLETSTEGQSLLSQVLHAGFVGFRHGRFDELCGEIPELPEVAFEFGPASDLLKQLTCTKIMFLQECQRRVTAIRCLLASEPKNTAALNSRRTLERKLRVELGLYVDALGALLMFTAAATQFECLKDDTDAIPNHVVQLMVDRRGMIVGLNRTQVALLKAGIVADSLTGMIAVAEDLVEQNAEGGGCPSCFDRGCNDCHADDGGEEVGGDNDGSEEESTPGSDRSSSSTGALNGGGFVTTGPGEQSGDG